MKLYSPLIRYGKIASIFENVRIHHSQARQMAKTISVPFWMLPDKIFLLHGVLYLSFCSVTALSKFENDVFFSLNYFSMLK